MATQASQRTSTGISPENHSDGNTRAFIDSVCKLADQQLDAEAFYTEIVSRARQLLEAVNVAAWMTSNSGEPYLVCESGVEQQTLLRSEATQQQHLRIVADVFRDGGARSAPMVAVAPDSPRQDVPQYVLHLQPVLVDGKVAATIQLVGCEPSGSDSARHTKEVLGTLAAVAASFHQAQDVRQMRQATQWMTQFDKFVQAIHASLDPTDIAYEIANNGPKLLNCDRLIVLLRRGRRFRVAAVTGQSTIHSRANAVQNVERLVACLSHHEAVVRYPEPTTTLSPREVEELEAYLDEAHAKGVAACMFSTPPARDAGTRSDKRRAFGGFIAEKYAGKLLPDAELARAEHFSTHSSQALHNAIRHRGVFLRPVWSTLDWILGSIRSHVAGSMLLLLLALASLFALIFLPADFDLVARGTLQPEQQQHIFARIDGTIDELLVTEGQRVAKDEVLARLSNPALDLELEKVVGELRTSTEKLAAIKSARLADRTDRADTPTDHAELASQEEELRKWIDSLGRQQALLEQQRQDLQVRTPLGGKVITWNIDPTLRNRPVKRGQLLMTVANLEGPWELDLMLPDRSAGHFLEAKDKFGGPLEVVFTLATDPNNRVEGRVKKTAHSIQLAEQDASLQVTVGFDRDAVQFLQPGATVMAKIHCGRRSLGYVWLHDLWELLQYRVFFRF